MNIFNVRCWTNCPSSSEFIALLRYNLHTTELRCVIQKYNNLYTVKLTCFKYTIKWFLVYVQVHHHDPS